MKQILDWAYWNQATIASGIIAVCFAVLTIILAMHDVREP